MDIPDNLKSKIDLVISYVGDFTNDWVRIKKELLNSLPWEERTRFSRRHPFTKKHSLNAFEELVMAYWKERTGVELVIPSEKLHDPNWVRRKRGWALVAINEDRKRARLANEK